MHNQHSHSGLASLVASKGRGDDTMLVHMTPGEVHGLHALAFAHGGTPSINPETGLYEFGFLSKILPTVLGFGLNFLFPGLGALGSAALVGAGETIRTGGDLGKGLMAGLGAYGGAGLGSALGGVGAAASDASTKMLAQEAGANLGKDAAAKAAEGAVANQVKTMAAPEFAKNLSLGQRLSNIGAGAKEVLTGSPNLGVGSLGGVKMLGSQLGTAGVAGLGTTAMNAMTPDMQIPKTKEEEQMYWESQGYDPSQGFLGGRFIKSYPGYNPDAFRAAQGGVIPAPNQMYPMANIQHSEYATSIQNPRKTEVVGGYDAAINPFTGEETRAQVNFAEGGETTRYQPRDPGRGDTGGETMAAPQGGLREYYQSLLQAPVNQAPSAAPLANYMAGLNQFVTSPVVAPKGIPITPKGGDTTGTGTAGTGTTIGGTGNARMPSWTINPVTGEPMDLNDMITGGENQTVPVWRRQPTQPVQPTQPAEPTINQPTQPQGPIGPMGPIGFDNPFSSIESVDVWANQQPPTPIDVPNTYRSMYDDAWTGDPNDPRRFVTSMLGSGPAEPVTPDNYWDAMAQQGGYQGDATMMYAGGGGIGSLEYAAGGKLLRGPGDGMSDSIKANIGGRQEARLADGEFVVPADVVSHLGNGSTEAGSRKLYKMMDNIRRARTGRKQQAPAVKADKYLPK